MCNSNIFTIYAYISYFYVFFTILLLAKHFKYLKHILNGTTKLDIEHGGLSSHQIVSENQTVER